MASRKDQKEQARAQRLAAEQSAKEAAARKRRFTIFGGVGGLAIVAIFVILLAAGAFKSSPKKSAQTTGTVATANASTVDAMLAGLQQSGTTLGNPSAKLKVTYFGDLQCPYCADFSIYGLPTIIDKYVRTGQMKITYRSVCTATCNDPNMSSTQSQALFEKQQVAAYAAGMQGKFWNYAELFYREQGSEDSGYVTASFLNGLAHQISGLNLTKWQTDRTDPDLTDQLSADAAASNSAKASGTPTFLVTGPKGSSLAPGLTAQGSDQSYGEQFAKGIEQAVTSVS